ncbi:MAG: CaiB/BaiF CoA transferase family protein [Methylocystaceae bacterium]
MVMPLQGVKVLDLSRLLPGPFASQVLADYGAEVIKVEDLEAGDYLRVLPPLVEGRGVMFHPINRGKKSLSLNLKSVSGQEVFRRLIKDADVLLEGFRPGVMERLGLGYDNLKLINPRLIYCSITGYGYTGPYRDRAGHDINYLSYAGIAGLIGELDRTPVIPGVQIADIGGGAMWAVIAILMALRAREITGEGQFCDVSMLDGAFSWTVLAMGLTSLTGTSPHRGNELLSGGYACYNIYPTADGGYVSLGAVEFKFWQEFCIAINRKEYIPLHIDPTAQPRLKREITELISTRTRQEWVEAFADYDFCFAPVLNYQEAMSNDQLRARQMIVDGNYSGLNGAVTGLPVKLSLTPGQVQDQVPEAGENTIDILKRLGYTTEQIQEMINQKAVAQSVKQ